MTSWKAIIFFFFGEIFPAIIPIKREIVPIFLHAKLGYDTMQKKLYVTSYKIDSKTESGLFNISVQALANKIVYTKVLTKLQFEVGKAIDEQKKIANKL